MSNGTFESLGFIGAQNLEALETLPDGRWVGTDGFIDEFWDVTDGDGVFVGSTGPRNGVDAGLSYNPVDGQLYNLNGAEFFDISPRLRRERLALGNRVFATDRWRVTLGDRNTRA